ncbi:MAG: hypothetical protein WDZ35_08470 [Crocinitomicaceae bacterium]
MKKLFTLFILLTAITSSSFSQKSFVNYDRDSKWFIGINAGATWHSRTEVDNLVKGGYGFTFGRSFGMKPENLFSWDLRFRYLHGWWGGQSTTGYTLNDSTTSNLPAYGANLQTYQDTLGYFIPNFRTELLSGSLELALNTNRLRQNTGWNFQIFGGIGVKMFHTAADMTAASGQIYDYENVSSTSQSALLNFQDGDHETDVVGSAANFNVDWMPSFGAGVSYQITPWASIGISHKMTWTRSNAEFDLMPNDAGGINTSLNDLYHYSSAGIRFHLLGGSQTTVKEDPDEDVTDINNFDNPNTNPIVTPTPKKKPIVDIYDPSVNPYTTELDHFIIRADVHHVDGKQNITFKQNGNINSNYSYNAASDRFESSVILQPGQNIFEITGVNEAGQDYESTIIIYKRDEPVIEPPIVTITNPSYSPYTTSNSTFNFSGTVLNVDSKAQIKLYFNGAYQSNFTYNVTTKALYATLQLQEGTNTVMVTATNEAGSDSKTVKIIYDKPREIQPPVVDFIFPGNDPHHSILASMNISASVLNVASKNDILVKINGQQTTNFTYNTSTKQVTFHTNLNEGANVIAITGTNEAGSDQENTTIFYQKPEIPKPPIVTFVDPSQDPITVYNSTYQVKAKVEHVSGASGIKLKINGNTSQNFAYSTSSQMMSFVTNLAPGSNVIEITGTNNVGQDLETTTIIYRKIQLQTPPVVDISYPANDNQEFNTPSITLVASVLNVSSASNISVLVNGNQTTGFNYNTATKILSLPLQLIEGANTVVISGTNSAGTDTDTRIIIYKKPTVPTPPTVSFVNPSSSPHLVSTDTYTLTAKTTHIDSKSQISLLVNGVLIPGTSYTFTSNHQIVYTSNLIQGNNLFQVKVNNNDGYAEDMTIITYQPSNEPCVTPTVGYISPVPYSTVNDPNIIVDAQINNHTNGSLVEMLLNGTSVGFMNYNSTTSIASLATVLEEGSNAITVIATNNCGSNQATFTLTYEPAEAPCEDPELSANGQTTFTTQDASVNLQTGVTGISDAANITVTLNGNSIPSQFDLGTGTIKLDNVNLSTGNNTIVITATNDCGKAILTYHILREACKLPIISTPAFNNGYTTTDYNLPFTVNVANVTANEVELIVNAISQSFTLNAGVLSAGINLSEGNNTVVVNATNACGTATETYTFVHESPCTVVSYSLLSPSSANTTVTDEHLNLSFHTSGTLAASGISATHNGNNLSSTFDSVSGEVHITGLTLVEGANTILVQLTNDCSSTSISYTINYDGCIPPVINISNVANGTVYNSSTIDFNAMIENSNGASNISLSVNGVNQSFDFDEQTQLLTSTLSLNEGGNTLSLIVNGCEQKTETLTVIYEVPCQPISYNFMHPTTNAHTVVESDYEITLNLTEVTNQQQISVTHNGDLHPFTFNTNSHILTVDGITLAEGTNTITVTASNDCSSETIAYTIQYDGCQPPVIDMGSNTTNATDASFNLNASVTNIDNSSGLQLLLNNQVVTFVFDPQNGSITADLNLQEGLNTITLNANGCAANSKTIEVTYTAPCDPIVIIPSVPSQTETSVADDTYTVKLIAQHASASSISVTLNGAAVPHNYSNEMITIPQLSLVDGDNTVVVTLSNDCSNETVTYVIHHDGCDAPAISFSGNPDAVTTNIYTLSAIVTQIDDQSNITVTHNGNPVTFTYDSSLGNLSAQLNLTEGSNMITVNANGCVSTSENFQITYTVPCDPVSFSLSSPNQLSSVVNTASTNISLGVQSVENTTDISVTLNGSSIPFTFKGGMIIISNIALIDGANTIEVVFGNSCSSETVVYTIESDQCDGPVISVANSTITTNDPIFTFNCAVQNVTDGNNIQLSVNGQNVSSTFDPVSGALSAQMTLQEGSNDVTVTAEGCSETSVTYTVNYQVPCDPITFTHVIPATNDTIFLESNTYTVKINATHVQNSNVTTTLNGNNVNFNFLNGSITIPLQNLQTGNNTLVVQMNNECSNAQAIFHLVVGEPCTPPVITLNNSSAVVNEPNFNLNATVTDVDSPSAIVVKLNNQTVPFTLNNGVITAQLTLNQGSNSIKIEAAGCESVVNNWIVTFEPPCDPVSYTLLAPTSLTAASTDASYNVQIGTANITNPTTIAATLNGASVNYTFDAQNGQISLSHLPLTEGQNNLVVSFLNDCSDKELKYTIDYTAPVEPCGPRFNPGNSEWQFCLVTPGGTYNRNDLANNASFTYSGPATAAYFSPIAGGGDAIVGGQAFPVQNGQYYLFEGNLTVDVSSTHPGSMGHWEICITSDNTPTFGNGNNRPTSPCETTTGGNNGGGGNGGNNGNNGGNEGGNGSEGDNDENDPAGRETNTNNNEGDHDQTYLKPEFKPLSPSNFKSVSTAEQLSFKTKVLNVNDKSALTLYLNGSVVRTFSYNGSSQELSAVLSLKGGNNTIKVAAKNGDKSAEAIYAVSYAPPKEITPPTPVITNVNPTSTSGESSISTYSFKAKVENVTSKSDIQLYLNGKPLTVFTYSSSSKQVSAVVRLSNGNNTLKLVAQNKNQKAERLYTIQYKVGTVVVPNGRDIGGNTTVDTKTKKPTIIMISPTSNNTTVSSSSYLFKVKVEHVTSKSNIQLYVNGSPTSGFTYSSGNNQVVAVLKLRAGVNTIKLVAKNGGLTESQSFTITYKAVTPPRDTNTKPPSNQGTNGSGDTNKGGNTNTRPPGNGSSKNTSGGTTKTTNGTNNSGTTKTTKPDTTKTIRGTKPVEKGSEEKEEENKNTNGRRGG